MNSKQQLAELVRYVVKQTLNELMSTPSWEKNTSFDMKDVQQIADPSRPPMDAMTPLEKAKMERDQEKERRIAVKSGEDEMKNIKNDERDFQQKLQNIRKWKRPMMQKKLQALKGGIGGTTI